MVILDFSTLSGTNLQILTCKRYDEHPRDFHIRGLPPYLGASLLESYPSIMSLVPGQKIQLGRELERQCGAKLPAGIR